jgi:hypothetical protein
MSMRKIGYSKVTQRASCDYRRIRIIFSLFAVALASMAAGAARSAEPTDASVPAEQPAALGVLEPVSVAVQVAIPRDGLWRSLHGSFVCADTIEVRDEKGARLLPVTEEPQTRQYRVRLDGCLRFCKQDAHKRVSVSYQYRPRRAALLPARASTDYQDAVPTLEEVLAAELRARGFVLASQDDVADALTAIERQASSGPSSGSEPVDGLVALAHRVNAAYLVLPSVDADEASVLAGFYSYGSARGNATAAGNSVSESATSYQVTTPVAKNMMQVAVGLAVYQGTTGEVVTEQTKSASKRVHFREFGPARRSLIRDLVPGLVTRWREQHP